MKIKAIVLSIVVFIISLMILFQNNDVRNEKDKKIRDEMKNALILKLQNKSSRLNGIQIKSLSRVLGDSLNGKEKIVFYYSGSDCGTCVKKGFNMINDINKMVHSISTYIIATKANISFDQDAYDYSHYIYEDEMGLLRKELKYFYTPVLIYLDTNNVVLKLHFPIPYEDEGSRSDFIDNLDIL